MKRIIGLAALLALLPSWLGLLGDWYWALDLFAHFRWQYLLASGAVAIWAAWRGQRRTLALAALTLLLNAALIGRLAWNPELRRVALASDFTLRVLSQNVLQSNRNTSAVFEHVMAADADVVLLVEVDQWWLTRLAALKEKYPYVVAEPRPDHFGIALFSRIPLTAAHMLRLGGADFPTVEVRMHHQGRDLVLIGMHAMSPPGQRNASLRDRQLTELSRHVGSIREPVLVLGDLNATPWSAAMRIVTAGRLGWRSRSPPWTPTWSVHSPFAIPIDHVLVTTPLLVTSRTVGPDVGSDHRSLSAEIGWYSLPAAP